MAEVEARPEHMSEQDWTNFQIRYRPQPGAQTPAPAPGAAPAPAPAATPGVPGAVDPALKNPAPSPAPTLQPSPAPQIGDATSGSRMVTGGGLREQAPGLQDASAAPAAQNPQQQMQGMLRSSIMGMLGQNVNSASVADADLAPQSQAFRAAAERSQAARRAETVHAAQRGGYGNSGALDQRLDALSQQTGQAIGQNDANLVGQKLETRRGQLVKAMELAQQAGLTDEANQLQREIANLGARVQSRGQDISREGLQLQNNLANLDSSTRIYLGDLNAQMQREGVSAQERMARMDSELRRYGIDVQGNLGLLDTALRGQLGNRQIDLDYDRLGVDVGEIQARMNRDAVIGGLQG
jgi:hypothetical protein